MATLADDLARGRSLRATLKRSEQSQQSTLDRDPVAIVEAQNAERLPDLVPVRMARMLQSPFAYYRGTAAVMASDLRAVPVTGERVLSSGDAHLANFGLYASPERRVLFDLNDFDEAATAPWEWDLKRLATSVVVGGRDAKLSAQQCAEAAQATVRAYRTTLATLFELNALERHTFAVETGWLETLVKGAEQKLVRRTVKAARQQTSETALHKLTVESAAGQPRIRDVPPLTRHVRHLSRGALRDLVRTYAASLDQDVAVLLSQFTVDDFVLRVVGVGSVGTRCYLLLLTGPAGEPLFLQVKEASRSVLEAYGGQSIRLPGRLPAVRRGQQGYRVVTGQRVLQAESDRFLGWVSGWSGDGVARDVYLRQFRDMKGSVDTATLSASEFTDYARLCAALLARAHSQTPGAAAVHGYLGGSELFDEAVTRWALGYADQVDRDFAALQAAAASGRVPVERGG